MPKKGTKIFWKACSRDGFLYRRPAYGYEHIINGRSFFCEVERVDEDYTRFTDKTTGYDAGTLNYIEKRFEKIVEEAKKLPDIFTYPKYKDVAEELLRKRPKR